MASRQQTEAQLSAKDMHYLVIIKDLQEKLKVADPNFVPVNYEAMQAQDVKAPQIQVQVKDMKLGSLNSLEQDVEGIDPFDIDNDSPINFNPSVSAIKKNDSNATSQLNPLLQR